VVDAVAKATARRCVTHDRVYVPVDATSLTVVDQTGHKGFGAVGTWTQASRGVHVMTAFVVGIDGTPLGVCGQSTWVRAQRAETTSGRSGDVENRETRFWLEQLRYTHALFAEQAPRCTPWFQLDRGGDCWPVLAMASSHRLLLTVRAAHDRCLDGRAAALWATLEHAPIRAVHRIDIPARPPRRIKRRVRGRRIHSLTPPRRARVAKVAVRAQTVAIELTTAAGQKLSVDFNAVLVKERGRSRDRIEWLLLTTHPISTRADVLAIVRGYKHRWRIEELHRTWKRGLCRVEDTQLRSRDAVLKWATVLAAVASRAMRLAHLARSDPGAPATNELTRNELDALIALRQPPGIAPDYVPTLAQAVRWLADLGGYTGPWNGPAGPTVVGRGLHDVLVAARAFENRDKKR
jgi:hypothetical protein